MVWLAKALLAASLLPGFAPAPVQPAAGTVLLGTFPGTLRPGAVYLPPGYSSAQRYPVVYLLHGMPGSPTEYLGGGAGVPSWAAQRLAAGTARPFIAVMPAAGARNQYNGEWAGPWETALVDRIVPWIDAHLSTIATRSARVIAGLSAGGYGAIDMALRNPTVFGRVEAWSGYFRPLHDGPFEHATKAVLAANNPTLLAPTVAPLVRRERVRFFLSTGPAHSHWYKPEETIAFARVLRGLGLEVRYHAYMTMKGQWRVQVDTGLAWAFGR